MHISQNQEPNHVTAKAPQHDNPLQIAMAALRDTRNALKMAQPSTLNRQDTCINQPVHSFYPAVSPPSHDIDSEAESPSRSKLRIVGISDEFTTTCISSASNYKALSRDNWQAEIENHLPDFLFVESAWKGNGGQWTDQINRISPNLLKLIDYCNQNEIPTVFWNKEDPVHYNSFISTASKFDYVFTTDIGSINKYKTELNHPRVYLMPFFAEPSVHTPIKDIARESTLTFAGAYYHRYPERAHDFDAIINELSKDYSITIYDRNSEKPNPDFEFPSKYKNSIKPGLPFNEISQAYKSGIFGLNLNSVKDSQSMFARRVFDLISSYTHVVSNYSPAIRLLFGDLVTCSDDPVFIRNRLEWLRNDPPNLPAGSRLNYRNQVAFRKICRQHSTSVRLQHLASKIWSMPNSTQPKVTILSLVKNISDAQYIYETGTKQLDVECTIILVANRDVLHQVSKEMPPSSQLILVEDNHQVDERLVQGDWFAVMNPENYYGPHYLGDLLLNRAFTSAEVIGKGAFGEVDSKNRISLKNPFDSRTFTSQLLADRCVQKVPQEMHKYDWNYLSNPDRTIQRADQIMYSADEFEFGSNTKINPWLALENELKNVGITIQELNGRADNISSATANETLSTAVTIDGVSRLVTMPLGTHGRGAVQIETHDFGLMISSSLEGLDHRYIYALSPSNIEDLPLESMRLPVVVNATPGLNLSGVIVTSSADGSRTGTSVFPVNQTKWIDIPENSTHVHFGLRVQGSGETIVKAIHYKDIPPIRPARSWMSTKKVLTLTNVYPSRKNLYRNGFIHSRVSGYKQEGIETDVFCLQPHAVPTAYEFEGVSVVLGNAERLRHVIRDNNYDVILVHFLDEQMWSVLEEFVPSKRVIVWIHGAEVQPWYRRDFNYVNDNEREHAVMLSDKRMAFWRRVLPRLHPNVHLIFVSEYFANEVMEDTGISIDKNQYSIIHNVIATSLFEFIPKSADQRFKVLSIRPFASRKYANDLSVEAVLRLSSLPIFEKLEFCFIGDGKLFDETLEPLRRFENVKIRREFLTQNEIAQVHKEYGIFLCPTRMDSQGVSKDEAMSSGLIPVTSNSTAIPEFVSNDCGWLAPAEDSAGLAEGIHRIAEDPQLFASMSNAAAARVRRQSGPAQTLGKELEIIRSVTGRGGRNI